MADDPNLRSRRSRKHKKGDHSLCRPERCPNAPATEADVVALHSGPTSKPMSPPASLAETYRRRLDAVERLETPEGQQVMALVAAIDAGGHTASGLAALSRELRAAADVALANTGTKGDRLDELAERRRQREAQA